MMVTKSMKSDVFTKYKSTMTVIVLIYKYAYKIGNLLILQLYHSNNVKRNLNSTKPYIIFKSVKVKRRNKRHVNKIKLVID